MNKEIKIVKNFDDSWLDLPIIKTDKVFDVENNKWIIIENDENLESN